MRIGDYALQSHLGAGPDGVAYRGVTADGVEAEVVRLAGEAVEPEARELLRRRVEALRFVAGPTVRRVLGAELDAPAPWVALAARTGRSLAARAASPGDAVDVGLAIAETLRAAHPFGVSGFDLRAGAVEVGPSGRLIVDGLGLAAGATADGPRPWRRRAFDPAADVAALGALLAGIAGPDPPAELEGLLAEIRREDPVERPSAAEVSRRLAELAPALRPAAPRVAPASADRETMVDPASAPGTDAAADDRPPVGPGGRIGRYDLVAVLGRGGAGRVFRALDRVRGAVVAVKVLERATGWSSAHVKRFRREARLLQEIESPHVARVHELNEERGIHYMALEFVPGPTLEDYAEERGRFPEREALELVADVARGLVAAHQRGIVHRDVKPGNALLTEPGGGRPRAGLPRLKVCDFGLGRGLTREETRLTKEGLALGTPAYMAPEQCLGEGDIGPEADVYAVGIVLHRLLVGRTPFELAESTNAILAQHLHEVPEPVSAHTPEVSEVTSALVERCLAKARAERPADAAAFLDEVERILAGRPVPIVRHPAAPPTAGAAVVTYTLRLELEAGPRALWPLVSNTERLNRAIGLPAVRFAPRDGDPHRFEAGARQAGLALAWREHPYEWVEGRRLGVLREFSRGPIAWYTSSVELTERAGGGATVEHTIRLEPRHLLGRCVAAFEVGLRTRRALRRVYRRIDGVARHEADRGRDAFEAPAPLRGRRRARLDAGLERLATGGLDAEAVAAFGEHLAGAPPQEIARIRPRVLARRLERDEETALALCLRGAAEGLLELLWDVVCPVCRVPSGRRETLRAVARHDRCAVCARDFELDFARSVELVFRVHPAIRSGDAGTYCVGGPAHFPHVAAQVRLAPGERLDLALDLEEGAFEVRSPQLAPARPFRVDRRAGADRLALHLEGGGDPPDAPPPRLAPGRQALRLENPHDEEVLVKVERRSYRDDAFTAAQAATHALFRELFPGEVLAPSELVGLSRVVLVMTELEEAERLYDELGEGRAFAIVHRHLRLLREAVTAEGGAVVKTVGDGLVAAFDEADAAVRAALAFQPALAADAECAGLSVRTGVHAGPALVAALDEHLDYFGSAPRLAAALPGLGAGGDVVLSEEVAALPEVAALWRATGRRAEVVEGAWRRRPLPAVRLARLGAAQEA